MDRRPRLVSGSPVLSQWLEKIGAGKKSFRHSYWEDALSRVLACMVLSPTWYRISMRKGDGDLSGAARVVDLLGDAGLMEIKPGFFDRTQGTGRQTRFRATKELVLALHETQPELDWTTYKPFLMKDEHRQVATGYRLRSGLSDYCTLTGTTHTNPNPTHQGEEREGKLPATNHPTYASLSTPLTGGLVGAALDYSLTESQETPLSSRFASAPDSRFAPLAFQMMEDVDAWMPQHTAAYLPLLLQYHTELGRHAFALDGLPFIPAPLYRVFNRGRWSLGGRYYGGQWQGWCKADRHTITIDGEPTAELDYAGYHPRMLYHLQGIDPGPPGPDRSGPGWDPYQISWPRPYAKLGLNIAINAQTRLAALRACARHQGSLSGPDGESLPRLSHKEWERVLDELDARHPDIQHCLGSDAGIRLQALDAKVCGAVIFSAALQGIPILSVHDSFICRQQDQATVLELMTKAYSALFGHAPVI